MSEQRQHRVVSLAEAGQALPLVALVLPLLLAVIGLALDGGVVFDARRELQNVADTAAHAGATEVDLGFYRQSGGTLVLDTRNAEATARDYVADYNALHRPDQQVSLDDAAVVGRDRLVVRVSRVVNTAFLRIVGIPTVRIAAVAGGTARSGGA
jgi:Flp pilus assembly protein TadG